MIRTARAFAAVWPLIAVLLVPGRTLAQEAPTTWNRWWAGASFGATTYRVTGEGLWAIVGAQAGWARGRHGVFAHYVYATKAEAAQGFGPFFDSDNSLEGLGAVYALVLRRPMLELSVGAGPELSWGRDEDEGSLGVVPGLATSFRAMVVPSGFVAVGVETRVSASSHATYGAFMIKMEIGRVR